MESNNAKDKQCNLNERDNSVSNNFLKEASLCSEQLDQYQLARIIN